MKVLKMLEETWETVINSKQTNSGKWTKTESMLEKLKTGEVCLVTKASRKLRQTGWRCRFRFNEVFFFYENMCEGYFLSSPLKGK